MPSLRALRTRVSHRHGLVPLTATGASLVAALAVSLAPLPDAVRPAAARDGVARAAVATPQSDGPNVVLVTTDDQTLEELRWMPRTRRLLGAQGVTFSEAISPHPLCCPARAEILTGQFAQNNGVRHNRGRYGGFKRLDTGSTLATWLHDAGYRTAFVGKFLNGYSPKVTVPGWDVWNPVVQGVYRYYGYKMWEDGDPHRYRHVHSADLVGRRTVDYVEELSGDRPFFIWSSHIAPHSTKERDAGTWMPPEPAVRHAGLFPGVEAASVASPSFNERDVSDKPVAIARLAPQDPAAMSEAYRQRIRALQSVDEAVGDTVRALREAGELEDTLLLFTSDNGYLLGEHRFAGKDVPYEEAMRVPLLVRGPGVPHGAVRPQTVTTVDLAPTITEYAGVTPGLEVDGRGLRGTIEDARGAGWDTVLIQAGTADRDELAYGWHYRGVRTDRYTYVSYPTEPFAELYDRRRDPSELTNVADEPDYAAVRTELERRMTALVGCTGTECRVDFGPVPKPGR
ncbi:sulfatase [Nocardioides sp. WL0053]|uniref:Sulfatase n=1 Tax=Nocardioides jiangsuensis TaxID=2866161 RepID=A0ABS7RLR7_9ACTN|nr:sulfatase [Nocardioides jiangsuensis]MBY9075701.1 sulfatase [Nocardioides jiangsuensis]